MVRRDKKLVRESSGSVYDMIAAIENRIDELEDMDFYGEDYFESYKHLRESSKKKLTTVVSRAEWEKLRVFLKKNKIEYNPSEYGKDIHVQVWVNDDERRAVDDFIDTLDESYCRRGKKPMRESVSFEQIYDDVIEFFDEQGWDTSDDRVRSYASAVADHLYHEPDYRYPETLIQWLKDTRMHCPEEIEWMDDSDVPTDYPEFMESYCRRGKKPMRESVSFEQIYDDVIEFFDEQGWDTSDDSVRNYASGVADLLAYDPKYMYPETLTQWLKDTEMNYPEDIEFLNQYLY